MSLFEANNQIPETTQQTNQETPNDWEELIKNSTPSIENYEIGKKIGVEKKELFLYIKKVFNEIKKTDKNYLRLFFENQNEDEQSYNQEEWEKINTNKDLVLFDNIQKGIIMGVPLNILKQYIKEVITRTIDRGEIGIAYRQIKNSGIEDTSDMLELKLIAYNKAKDDKLFIEEAMIAKELWGEENQKYQEATQKEEDAKQKIKDIANLNIELPSNVSLAKFLETIKSIEQELRVDIMNREMPNILGSIGLMDLLGRVKNPNQKAREISLVNFLRPHKTKIEDIEKVLSIKFTTVKRGSI